LIRGELDEALARPGYGRSKTAGDEERANVVGHRHGSRTRSLTGTFGPVEIDVPRARLNTPEGRTTEWKSQALRAYQRRTLAADARRQCRNARKLGLTPIGIRRTASQSCCPLMPGNTITPDVA
jgi:hypothetical protein